MFKYLNLYKFCDVFEVLKINVGKYIGVNFIASKIEKKSRGMDAMQ